MSSAVHRAEAYRFYGIAELYVEGDKERMTALLAANFHATMASIPDVIPVGGYVRD